MGASGLNKPGKIILFKILQEKRSGAEPPPSCATISLNVYSEIVEKITLACKLNYLVVSSPKYILS